MAVKLNVGGFVFQSNKDLLETFPDSKLAKLDVSCSSYNPKTNEFYFIFILFPVRVYP